MRKLRLYLDTSVISDIDAPEDSQRGAITKEFFRIVTKETDDYELYISPVTLEEIHEASEEKQSLLIAFLKKLPHIEIPKNEAAENLAWIYVLENVLSENHIDDLTHVAYAVSMRCDYVISWNMKHLVNARTISRINEVNVIENCPKIFIATPIIVTGENRS